MLKQLLFLTLGLLLNGGIFAQNTDYTSAEDSDPEARKILNQVRQKYEGYTTIEAAFALDLEFPEQPKETQRGTIARQGDNYRLKFAGQEVISDGDAVYMIMHDNESIQINNMPEPGEEASLLSPEGIFNFYDNGEFIYSLIDTQTEGGIVVHLIEFKPTDKYSEFAKLRMAVNRDTKDIVRIKAFAKDGSRYTFRIENMNPDKRFTGDYFQYNKANYPGFHEEDLRY